MTTPMLAGTTVLDLSSVGPATRASSLLADYGARVVKVAPVPRDAGVQITPPHYAYSGHRGLERAQFDLKSPDGKDAFLRLAAKADVIIESFRPGVVARLGIGYDDVQALNAGIIYCSTSGFGQDGPFAAWAAHDLNYQAMAGVLDCGERAPGDKPALPGATFADSAGGGMQAVMAILAALVRRGTTGEGAYLDVAIVEGVLSLTSLYIDEYLATGAVPGPGHNILTGRYACYDTYQCADGAWVAVGAIEPAFYSNLCRVLGCDEHADGQLDDARQPAIRAAFTAAFASKPRDEWLHAALGADACISPVWSVPDLVDDPQLRARGVFVEAEHPTAGTFRQLGPLLAGMDKTPRTHAVPDASVTHTDALLTEAGLQADEVASLRERGVVA
jgi:alpha-methylacyl-CoA racemase